MRVAHRLLECTRGRLILAARRALLTRLLTHPTATIDDVRVVVAVPPGFDPKLFGPVAGPLARAGIIRATGYARTGRAVGHARPVTVWELADRTAAVAWLATNPATGDTIAAEGGGQ
ncbi:hypothetical protein [Urbifossiella limnaea]|nr:hypothetical protein [Urbifossiella limnaea]